MRLPRFRLRSQMMAVAAFGSVFGLLVVVYREANRQINLVEAEYYHFRAEEVKDPAWKAAYARRAEFHDRKVRYYGGR